MFHATGGQNVHCAHLPIPAAQQWQRPTPTPTPTPTPHLEVCVAKGAGERQQAAHAPRAAHVAHLRVRQAAC